MGGKRGEGKHVGKEGLTGLGKVQKKKEIKENLELSDQDSNSNRLKELQSKGQLCSLSPTSGLGRLDPVRATVPPDYL